ncbi:VWA domain-containing protein [Chitinophaga sp. MM2321]|uniref:VWA domain-containing protein n=1 Tax=Chitinophaga sp. MM2321 TaxID=3137178 RepID=UPI0032D57500
MADLLKNIDWQQFHFLRPVALWLFVPLILLALLTLAGNKEHQQWKSIIASALRPYMFTGSNRWAFIIPLLAFLVGMSCAILGMAGPTWEKVKVPGQKIQAVVLIVMDLSRSMLATDIQPNRLERAKLKVSDFLDANPRAGAGLLAFAGTPHLVLPFTADYKLLKLHTGSLQNRVMPVQGGNMPLLIKAIDTLMAPQLVPGTVFLLTDAISADDAVSLNNYANSTIHRMEILLVSSPQGATVPGFGKVISRQDPAAVQSIRQNPRIIISPLTLDTTDVGGIAKRIRDKLIFGKDEKLDEKSWNDVGYLFLVPALLIGLFWFRKGWSLQWCWLLPVLIFQGCSVKSREADWWYTRDYQGQVLYNQQDYATAAARFVNLEHKATAAYKAGDYEAAAALFALDSSATGYYNRGLALAHLGRYEEAMQDFSQAKELDNTLNDKVNNSIHHVKQAGMQIDSVLRLDQPETALKEKKKDTLPLKERKRQGNDPSLSADTKVKDMPTSGDRLTDEVKTNIHQAQEGDAPPQQQDTAAGSSQDMKNIIFRKAPADPSEFLHKRFELQRKEYFKNVKPGKEQW